MRNPLTAIDIFTPKLNKVARLSLNPDYDNPNGIKMYCADAKLRRVNKFSTYANKAREIYPTISRDDLVRMYYKDVYEAYENARYLMIYTHQVRQALCTDSRWGIDQLYVTARGIITHNYATLCKYFVNLSNKIAPVMYYFCDENSALYRLLSNCREDCDKGSSQCVRAMDNSHVFFNDMGEEYSSPCTVHEDHDLDFLREAFLG